MQLEMLLFRRVYAAIAPHERCTARRRLQPYVNESQDGEGQRREALPAEID